MTNKTVRIPIKHALFIFEAIKTGDKEAAYQKAYPDASPDSLKSAASRLYNRPEIKQQIDEATDKATAQAMAEAEEIAKERIKAQLLDLFERRKLCADIVRGKQNVKRWYRVQDEQKHIDTTVDNPFALLRAVELDAKLEAEYYAKKELVKAKKELKYWEEPGYQHEFHPYLGTQPLLKDERELTEEEVDIYIKRSLTDERIHIPAPRLRPDFQSAGCTIDRDMETGKYCYVCPEEKVVTDENGNKGLIVPQPVERSIKESTNVNKTTPQPIDKQAQKPQPPPPPPDPTDTTGYTALGPYLQEIYVTYLRDQHSGTWTAYRNVQKMFEGRKLSPGEQAALEKETGWQYHPLNKNYIRKVR